MDNYYLLALVGVLGIAAFIVQCLGSIILIRSGKSTAKYVMIGGCGLQILGYVSRLFITINSSSVDEFMTQSLVLASSLGGPIFCVGFLLHALSLLRNKEHMVELQAIATAQAVELEQLRNS